MIEDQTTDWELVKENAAPLKRGRNAATLGPTLALSSKLSNKVKEDDSTLKMFESLVEPSEKFSKEYMDLLRDRNEKSLSRDIANELMKKYNLLDGDPLCIWIRYLKYHEETYPADTHSQFLIMERCTQALFNIPRYADDIRYIRICVLYADRTCNPNETFISYHQNKIGINTAIFWLAWAWLAEKKEDFVFAEKIYRKAISKKAEPYDIIDTRYKHFQRRMSRHFLNSAQNLENGHDIGVDIDSCSRRILGSISEEGVKFNHRSSHYATSDQQRISQHRSAAPSLIAHANNKAQKSLGFSVFIDHNHEHNPGLSDLDNSQITSGIGTITTERDKCKENNNMAERWNERGGLKAGPSADAGDVSEGNLNGQTIVQRWTTSVSDSRSTGGSFTVFVDEEFASTIKKDDNSGKAVDPGKSIRNDLDKPTATKSGISHLGSHLIKREIEKVMKVFTNEELCFEENRALMKRFTVNSSQKNFNDLKQLPYICNKTDGSFMDIDEGVDDSVDDNVHQLSKLNLTRDYQDCVSQSFHTQSTTNSSVVDSEAVGVAGDREETINTRLAARELSMMFSSPGMGEKSFCDKSILATSRKFVPTVSSFPDIDFRSKRRKLSSSNRIYGDGDFPDQRNSSSEKLYNHAGLAEKRSLPFEIFQDDIISADKADIEDVIQSSASDSCRYKFMKKPEIDEFGDISLIVSNDDTHEYVPSRLKVVQYDNLHSSSCFDALSRVKVDSSCLDLSWRSIPSALLKPSRNGSLIDMGELSCTFRRELGRGCYGTVLLCTFSKTLANQSQDAAIKIQRPMSCLAWEYIILQTIEKRIPVSLTNRDKICSPAFPRPLAFSLFSDGGILTMTAGSGINLLDVTNAHKGTVPELIAIYYTARMIAHLEILHLRCDILHCDIKPDNWVLTTTSPTLTEKEYTPIFGGDIMLVDFGRSVDLRSMNDSSPCNIFFTDKVVSEDMECISMREGKPWAADVDIFGLCASAHVLLFGCHMDVEYDDQQGRWGTKKKLRRYWRQDLWASFFGSLLNHTPDDESYSHKLGILRKDFERYLSGLNVMSEVITLLKGQHAYFPNK